WTRSETSDSMYPLYFGRSAYAEWIHSFLFSCRRRHTRCYRDWSSDVCSSDLGAKHRGSGGKRLRRIVIEQAGDDALDSRQDASRIGRASCRERGKGAEEQDEEQTETL